ncbi:MAG: hypothetical protein IIZ78_20655 [Clostridiales bacterium]|nr:hypothetical protein [Clostridiales bacterium]
MLDKLIDKVNYPELVRMLRSASTVSSSWGKLMQESADAIEELMKEVKDQNEIIEEEVLW